ncbi:phage antirepressor KilAC domain-containing protein (plasmid) [Acinetobacter thermotolerans]|uniref:phage antirepressor KilAC domain-containing protein n=1 Tax=Acinetobacter thermotolerans TaxID=3151487 RepID=UPI00325C2261
MSISKQLSLFEEDSNNNLSLRTAAKLLKFAPHKFNKQLAVLGYIFKSKSKTWEAYQKSVNQKLFSNEEVMIRHNSGKLIPRIQVKVTPKGYQHLKAILASANHSY